MAGEDVNKNQESSSNPRIIVPRLDDNTPSALLPNASDQENLSPAPSLPPPTATAIASPTSGRHPVYRGIRCRSGKWVSEIREPRKTTRIWLGTYPTPEMAAVAYDVAALALKGPEAMINFPGLAPSYPLPASLSAGGIRAAASNAAAAIAPPKSGGTGDQIQAPPPENNEASCSAYAIGYEFIDEEALFDMPKLLVDMAEGMLVSPPRLKSTADEEESPENYSRNDSLWTYP